MKKLVLLGALWFAAAGISAMATAADKAMEEKKAPAATKAASDTKAPAKDSTDTKSATAAKTGGLMVNINTASKEELQSSEGDRRLKGAGHHRLSQEERRLQKRRRSGKSQGHRTRRDEADPG